MLTLLSILCVTHNLHIFTFSPVLSHSCSFPKLLQYQSAHHSLRTHSIRYSQLLSRISYNPELCIQLCAPATVPALSASTLRLITSSKPFHPPRHLSPCASDSAFTDILRIYKFHLLTYFLTCQSQETSADKYNPEIAGRTAHRVYHRSHT